MLFAHVSVTSVYIAPENLGYKLYRYLGEQQHQKKQSNPMLVRSADCKDLRQGTAISAKDFR